jgi:hypothetical protein
MARKKLYGAQRRALAAGRNAVIVYPAKLIIDGITVINGFKESNGSSNNH